MLLITTVTIRNDPTKRAWENPAWRESQHDYLNAIHQSSLADEDEGEPFKQEFEDQVSGSSFSPLARTLTTLLG